jgi:endonuclease/exonuclease/phosphatase family metal-dependent hydrolase
LLAWEEFDWESPAGGSTFARLCVDADSDALDCRIEGADHGADAQNEPGSGADGIVVCAYNVERGLEVHAQIEAIASGVDMPVPDIVLISEADRGCSRSGGRNIADEYARALGMCYVYAVEFVELPRIWGPGGGAIRSRCEHGNAIISRFPLGNVRIIRHSRARSWNSRLQRTLRLGQPRFGGRVAVVADARVGDRLLRLYSVHFESGRRGRGDSDRDLIRRSQALEIVADADADGRSGPVVVGGDMNVVGYLEALRSSGTEAATSALFDAGFTDAHRAIEPDRRATSDSGVVIDLIVGRGAAFTDAGIGSVATWGELSDHLPIWARLAW